MRRLILSALPLLGSLAFATSAAQAVVLDANPAHHGQTSVAYPTDLGNYYGVALVPSAREGNSTTPGYLAGAGIPIVTSSGACSDPAAGTEPDILTAGSWPLSAPLAPICWHSGPVMRANETFTLEWEGQSPNTYWSTTKGYVQSYLSNVAAASGSLNSPYADTTQYWDGSSAQDRAANSSVFGGGCDDNGTAKCRFGSINGSGPGNQLPSTSDCPLSGNNVYGGASGGAPSTIPNNLCVTDANIQHEVTSLIDNDGLIKYDQPGHTPLVTVMTPPGVVVCLDAAGDLCSANGQITPPPPDVTTASGGGTIPAGTYQVVTTYELSGGEGLPSAPVSITTTGSGSSMTIPSPPTQTGATGWYAYVGVGGSFFRQTPLTAIGDDVTLTAGPVTSGPTPPTQPATFCSYHAQVTDPQSGQPVSYEVQPWTPFTNCDEPDIPALPPIFTPQQLETNAGERLVSPLSQSQLAAIVNPQFNGWFGLDGLEIDDQNGCQPLSNGLDQFTIGSAQYYIQRESNNAAVVDSDPYTYGGCVPADVLEPAFVVPSAINLGDTLDLDGSATASSLDIPNANYAWDFGDGTSGTGPSVEHTYTAAGNYTVKLTVTDRGVNQATISQPVQVLGATGLPVAPAPSGSTTSGGRSSNTALSVRLQLLPQGLRSVLSRGIAVRVTSSESANGFVTVEISRKLAKRAHIATGHKPFVVVGTGTVSSIHAGTVTLRLRMLSSPVVKKLKRLNRVSFTVRLALVDSAGRRVAVDVAGTY